MSLYNACKEVLEGVLLFTGQQYGHLSPASAKQLKPRAWVNVTAVPGPDRAVRDAAEVTWQVRVEASGLGAYYLDGAAFLNTLCQFGESLRCTISKQERKELAVYSRRIGEFSTIQCHTIYLPPNSTPSTSHPVEESVLTRPQDFPPAGLRVCFEVRCTVDAAMLEMKRLSSHMHLLHIINPEVELRLSMVDSSHTLVDQHHTREPSWAPLPSSPYRITTCLHHYLSAPNRHKKLHLARGSSYSLPPLALKGGASLSLKLYCTSAVVPHLSLHKGKKIPANKTCQHLHVSVFGPGNVPLLAAGSSHTLPLSCLADWESYGLNLEQSNTHPEPSSADAVEPACCCRLSNSRPASGCHPDRPSRVSRDHTLLLFMFLEDGSAGRGRVSCSNARWRQHMEQIQEVRGTLSHLIHSHQRKFRQAVHSTFNKLLCNYGTHLKTAAVMHTAFPLVADAVSSIVRHSMSNQFQKKCRNILNVQRVEDIQECIAQKLWEIAEKKLHISKSQTTFPHEPTSPELEQASSDCSIPTKQDTSERRTRERSDTSTQPPTFTATRENIPASLPSNSAACETISQGDNSRATDDTTARAQSHSLFQAMINSRRGRACVSQPTNTGQLLPSTELRGEGGPPAVGGAGRSNAWNTLTEAEEWEDSLLLEEDSASLLTSSLPPRTCVSNSGVIHVLSTSSQCVTSQSSADSFFEELESVDMEDSAAPSSAIQAGLGNCIDRSGEETQSDWSEMEWESDYGFDDLEQFSEFSAPEDSDFDTVCLSSDCAGEEREEEETQRREEGEEAEEDEEEWWSVTEPALESVLASRASEIDYQLSRAPLTAHGSSSSGGDRGVTECPSDEEWTAAMETSSGATSISTLSIQEVTTQSGSGFHPKVKETGRDEWLLWEEVEDNVCPAVKGSPLTQSSFACTLTRDTPPLVPDISESITTDVEDIDFQWD